MFRGFWGLKIVPGKTYTQTVDAAFRASLGVEIAAESRTSVLLTVDQKSFVLCSLTPGKVEQQLLDISLTEGEEITFETHGKNEIHLTGNFVADDEDDEDGMYGSSDDEEDGEDIDLSNISPEELQELINRGMIDPSELAIGSDESDEDYDSDDAETDGRIREITEEEEDELVEEAMSEDEEEEKPVVEVKIKKQAEKKRKPAAEEDVKPAAAAAAADAKPSKKAKQAEKAAAAKQAEKAEKPKQEKAEKPKQEKAKAKTLPGGVIVETKTEGAGAPAKKGQRIGMYYIGKLTNGKVFDQNTKGKPFWFRLGAGEVIKGWDAGIAGMKKGEERRLTIPGPMAYGARGAPPDIPPHATLVFDIRLVEFK
ncbi:peptidylprolyl isomerase fpr3 [Coemansia sp. RSA 2681]|nr:peptidylprolyl isomerase fpr3 [Coemansia sp. RSA 2681]